MFYMFLSIKKVFYFPNKFSEHINDNIMIYHTLLFEPRYTFLIGKTLVYLDEK